MTLTGAAKLVRVHFGDDDRWQRTGFPLVQGRLPGTGHRFRLDQRWSRACVRDSDCDNAIGGIPYRSRDGLWPRGRPVDRDPRRRAVVATTRG